MKNPIRRIKPEKTGVRAPLGELEKAVMRPLWDCSDCGCLAVEVQRHIEASEGRKALTTILTTLERLENKGIVRREPDGRASRFFAAVSEDDLEQRIVNGVLDSLIAQFPEAVATYLSQSGLTRQAQGSDGDVAVRELARRVRRTSERPRE